MLSIFTLLLGVHTGYHVSIPYGDIYSSCFYTNRGKFGKFSRSVMLLIVSVHATFKAFNIYLLGVINNNVVTITLQIRHGQICLYTYARFT